MLSPNGPKPGQKSCAQKNNRGAEVMEPSQCQSRIQSTQKVSLWPPYLGERGRRVGITEQTRLAFSQWKSVVFVLFFFTTEEAPGLRPLWTECLALYIQYLSDQSLTLPPPLHFFVGVLRQTGQPHSSLPGRVKYEQQQSPFSWVEIFFQYNMMCEKMGLPAASGTSHPSYCYGFTIICWSWGMGEFPYDAHNLSYSVWFVLCDPAVGSNWTTEPINSEYMPHMNNYQMSVSEGLTCDGERF